MNEKKKLRVGDRVEFRDNSYAFGVHNGKGVMHIDLVHESPLKVATIDLRVTRNGESEYGMCDIMVKGQNGFYFAKSAYARLIPPMHTITIDDKDIEISDESFENLKRQLLDG